MPVGGVGPVLCFGVEVIEVDGTETVRHAADGDDARALDRQQPIEQQARERVVAEVVGAELHLEAVVAQPARRHHDARVVDETVDLAERVDCGLEDALAAFDRGDVVVVRDGLAAGRLAETLDAQMVIVATATGQTALRLSKDRLFVPTVGVSDSDVTMRSASNPRSIKTP